MTTFIALDGEGREYNGEHVYNLLAASDGSYVRNDTGLTTEECFEYLLTLKQRHEDATFVSFYFSYDVNMMLGGLSPSLIERLREKGRCYAYDDNQDNQGYKIEYHPRKQFTLSIGHDETDAYNRRKFSTDCRVQIWDVFGFFQASFVNSLQQFGIGTEEEIASLTAMKAERGHLEDFNFEEVLEYNALECRLLVALMKQLDTSLKTAGIELITWNGAGAVAASLLTKYDIKFHIAQPEKTHKTAVHSAYFGGRIQALYCGFNDCEVYAHDLVSAYPSSIRNLPSLYNCKQILFNGFHAEYPYTIYYVSWRFPHDQIINPFPFRTEQNSVDYPTSGSGYYWSYEVEAALKHFDNDCIEVDTGYSFVPCEEYADYQPFGFVNSLFEARKRFKSEGNHAQLVVKLGLNSLYGKTAQGIGYEGNRPAFQSYIYAGMITSHTRARMLDLAMKDKDNVLTFATDGVYSRAPLVDDSKDVLGGWEVSQYPNLFLLKAGFYYSRDSEGTVKVSRVRGFRSNETNWQTILDNFAQEGIMGNATFPSRKFIGMKGSRDLSTWRQWIDGTKTLSFHPATGFPQLLSDNPLRYVIIPPSHAGKVSTPYDAIDYDTKKKDFSDFDVGD